MSRLLALVLIVWLVGQSWLDQHMLDDMGELVRSP